ncbi:MAG: hypothetical protein DBX44_00995 [Oscillospiraceae bacterium]|nr:MAG: hypothetical protein DBX44_00995 [Oscillospiraceae bacterium]
MPAAVLCLALALVTCVMGAVALQYNGDGRFALPTIAASGPSAARPGMILSSEPSVQPEQPDESVPEGEGEASEPVEKTQPPQELRAVTIKPGRDFSVEGDAASIREGIDQAIDQAVQLTMNGLVIDTLGSDGSVLYSSEQLPCRQWEEGFDPLSYAIEQGKANGLYVSVICYLTDGSMGETPAVLTEVNASLIDAVTADLKRFSSTYTPDAVLFDGYHNPQDGGSYLRYLSEGGGMGYDEYMRSVPKTLLTLAVSAMQQYAPGVSVGLLSEAVWANNYEDERGSVTRAYFCAQTEGNADTVEYLEEGMFDLVAVKAYGSITDPNLPYQAVASWWTSLADGLGIPCYIVHAADRAVTDAVGWSEYDQLARQVIDAREMAGYSGSIFNSLARLIENPKDCAGKLIGYFDGTVKAEHIMQDLELTKPEKTTFTSFDPSVLFTGHTDPNTDATINGQTIVTDENGYFQLEMQLTEGENVFTIVHKGKTVTYNITRITEVVKEVSPAEGVLAVDGGTELSFSAVAYSEANVYAVINGVTVPMTLDENPDEAYRDTAYSRFIGSYTLPDATTSVQNLGAIVVYGEWDGLTKSKTGATIHVNERLLPSDGTPVVITADAAETFSASTTSHYSEPTYFPLPKGALDYVVGDEIRFTVQESGESRVYSFYKLQSGLRVLSEDVAAVSDSSAPVNNRITGYTVKSDSRYTTITLDTEQQVSYTMRYTADAITIQFHYTNSLPDSMTLSKNPLFSAANFSGDTLTLPLRNRGIFMGCAPSYQNGKLVLRFNNPPSSVSKATIVIDPGHGGNDSGALGYLAAYPEKTINYGIATELADLLEAKGADVVLLDTKYNNYSLQQRVEMATQADPHLSISVHSNSSAYSASAAGTEAYYFNYWSSGLAQFSSSYIASVLNTTNRGQKFGYYYVTRTMQYPAILIETGFVSNQTEYHKLINEDYQQEIAQAISKAVSSYLSYLYEAGSMTGTESS